MAIMDRHFVTFFSPGTFVAEATENPIDSWDVEAAKDMANAIRRRQSDLPTLQRVWHVLRMVGSEVEGQAIRLVASQ